MLIQRIYQNLGQYLQAGKVLALYGPRQVGKTTLLQSFLQHCDLKYKFDSGDNLSVREVFSSQDFSEIKQYAEGYELIVLDEAQRIPQVGLGLKILVDQMPNIKVIATGSSSFELAGQIGEPLTGRKKTLHLYPISQIELKNRYNRYELQEKLHEWLIYGGYPEVIISEGKSAKVELLEELLHSYLLKDILELESVKSSKILLDLLRLIAFQVGKEVSLEELARNLSIDRKTVARYLDLFEKSFVVYNVRGFSRNLRKEVTKKSKYYFYDNGILNAILSNFNQISHRNDVGILWENFLFIERIKKRSYQNIFSNMYFWRTWDQKEIDLIEERDGKLYGYEFKWSENKRIKAPKDWLDTYPKEAVFKVINRENYFDFIL